MANDYYSLIRHDAIALMERRGSQRVLEVGCGKGNTLRYLREQGYAGFLAGVEREACCRAEAQAACDLFFAGDVEQLPLQDSGAYDAVLLLDVIEHLARPYHLIRTVAGLLNPGGYLVVSFPNVRNFGVLAKLVLEGTWDYQDSGILDRDHLRFFTRESFLKGVAQSSPLLTLDTVQAKPNRDTPLVRLLSRLPLVGDFFSCQFLMRFRRAAPTPL
jgi:2-polyprenyl-3-methyl-5-hydroxy-6-metoxy-1,4-benzoquinol methylase